MVGLRKSIDFRNRRLSRMLNIRCLSSFFVLLVFATTIIMVSDECNFIPRIKTVAGDNLLPTPWHRFKRQKFDSRSKCNRALQIVRCCDFSCMSSLRLSHSSKNASGKFENSSHSCPSFFQWIHEDLAPWRESGITEETIKSAQASAAFRVVIVGGHIYVDLYYSCVQSRTMFTIWGLLQLLERYPGMVPDVDFVFDCMDKPRVRRSKYKSPNSSPPPLFRYCSNWYHFDIPFPDWSFWGWPEVNISPWEEEFNSIKMGSKAQNWTEREHTAYWKGNTNVGSAVRKDLQKCNKPRTWGAEIIQQDWEAESRVGYAQSKLSSQCKYRYKIYAEGSAWSVSFKYILSCDSPVLVIKPQYYDFFTRWLMPKKDYWPVRRASLCPSIKFAVDWGNNNQVEAQAIGKRGQRLMQYMNMANVYDYMFHLLSEYSKLQKFKPKVPPTAQEVCKESILCLADSTQRRFLEMSTKKITSYSMPPCSLPPPNHDQIKKWLEEQTKNIKEVQYMEEMGGITS